MLRNVNLEGKRGRKMSRAPKAVRSRKFVVGALALTLVVVVVPSAIARGAAHASGQLSPAAQMLRARGYLIPDPAAYVAAKAKAAAAAGQDAGKAHGSAGPKASSVTKGWQGVTDPNFSPSDSTGSVGLTRYIEVINDEYGIYDRTVGGTPTTLETGALATLTGDSGSSGGFSNLSDPQVIWDPSSARFYYSALDVVSDHLVVGWSKDGSPSGAADFCKYDMDFGYGTNLPDYPKLGTTADFLLIGVNSFNSGGSYIGSDIDWMAKPGAGTTCPSQATVNTFKKGRDLNVKNQGGGCCAFTPVPAVQTDSSSTGWVVARTLNDPDTRLNVFQVTKDGSGNAVIPTNGTTVTVSSYAVPPNAPQSGTSEVLDTLDGRPMQAVSGFDPARGKTALWTNQTIAGGAGSKVRWYEIDPAGAAVLQTGDITDGSLYAFNAATSPDRVVNGANKAFGSNMATVFSTSSSSAFPAIQAVTKTAFDAQGGFISLKTSSVSNTDFSCDIAGGFACRWGDYSGARPDPAADRSGSQGSVWFTNAYTIGGSVSAPGWSTWNGALQLGQSFGYLRVTTNPAVASVISVDGATHDQWGLVWVRVPTGAHTVTFSDVPGYLTPAAIPVTVNEGLTTTVQGDFAQLGVLRVQTSPAVDSTITVDGITRNDWGVWTPFVAGTHTVCFGLVAGFDPPACQSGVVVTAGSQTDVTGTFAVNGGASGPGGTFGYLRTTTSPASPSVISVDGTPYDQWGLTWVRVPTGAHTVTFAGIPGFTTPAPIPVTVTNGVTTTVAGTFGQLGTLRVLTSPAVDATVYVDGVPRDDWGMWTPFSTGSHTVCFGWAAGFNQPVCQTANVVAGSTTTITGTFTAVS